MHANKPIINTTNINKMKSYFYLGPNGEQNGPVNGESLKVYGVTRETLVWCEGMPDWAKAGDVPELAPLFAMTPPPPPSRPTPPVRQMSVRQGGASSYIPDRCPDNHMVWAVLVTILCSPLFGIIAIVKASKVERLWYQGDKVGAVEAANSAKTWCWVAAIVGILLAVIVGIIAYQEAQAVYDVYDYGYNYYGY